MRLKHLALLVPLLMLFAVSALIGSCAEQLEVTTRIIKDINAREASDLIRENQDNPDFVIIDVRTPEEFADGHIENAINLDFRSDGFRNEIERLDRYKTYLIYCRSGNRSRGALEVMVEVGFMNLYHLSTGILGWLDEGRPTII
jgi:rhodanese-related sulfurtransferase